jgi:hypothetical protein
MLMSAAAMGQRGLCVTFHIIKQDAMSMTSGDNGKAGGRGGLGYGKAARREDDRQTHLAVE